MVVSQTALWTCSSCLRAQARRRAVFLARSERQTFSVATIVHEKQKPGEQDESPEKEVERGAMSRRLTEMAEETMVTGSNSDRKTMSGAGFSDDLKRQLEERIAQTAFQVQNQQVLSQVNMPTGAGRGTRDQAAARVWQGTESVEDAALRMLDDSHKKLRMPARKPTLSGGTSMRPRPKQKVSVADRLVNARDKTSIYAQQQENMTDEEREKFRKELKDRFSPGARPAPTTLQGLTSLANERIEDAIARGQFRNIQRGKGVNIERDYTASSPFLDTTEYFMNKIIQRQDIVPPWIEKQQELMKTINTFRQRLRNDWRRHAARSISSKGGSLDDQIRRAKSYALAEEKHNPTPATRSETMSSIDATGMLTTISVEQSIAAGVAIEPAEDPVQITITETAQPQVEDTQATAKAGDIIAEDTVILSTTRSGAVDDIAQSTPSPTEVSNTQPESDSAIETSSSTVASAPSSPPPRSAPVLPMASPFRDPTWEATEFAYHTLAIQEINALARSYNLMAPKLAQKPYHALSRELSRCYADIAPTLADEILQRSRKGPVRIAVTMHREGSVMEKFQGNGHVGKVRDEPEARGYGFKEFWKDLFGKDEPKKRQTV